MKTILKSLVAGALLASLTSLSGSAQTPVLTSTGNGTSPRTYNGTIGYSFSLDSSTYSTPQVLDALGIYDDGQASGTSQEVALFSYGTPISGLNRSSEGTELATATVTFDGGTGFVYAAATPVAGSGFTGILDLDTTYVLGTLGTDFVDGGTTSGTYVPPTTSSGVTLFQGQYASEDGTLEDPNNNSSAGDAYVGPNLEFGLATTPEPTSYALLDLGVLALLVARRNWNKV